MPWAGLGYGNLRARWRRKPMSMLSSLKARLGPPVRVMAGFRVRSGSPAQYLLRAEPSFAKSISAIEALVKRHVPLLDAKRVVERLLVRQDVTVDLPMLEDAALFEREMRELGIRAMKDVSAAADG
jgi:hypothetical protein